MARGPVALARRASRAADLPVLVSSSCGRASHRWDTSRSRARHRLLVSWMARLTSCSSCGSKVRVARSPSSAACATVALIWGVSSPCAPKSARTASGSRWRTPEAPWCDRPRDDSRPYGLDVVAAIAGPGN